MKRRYACALNRYTESAGRIWTEEVKLPITISQDEDGMFIAECPSIPGCFSQGKTRAEAEKNARKAIKECLTVRSGAPFV